MNRPRRDSFAKALARLQEALAEPETAMNRDASIQRFEFSIELAWKSIQEFLRDEGFDCRTPKACLREAFRQDLIDDELGWIAMLDDRNLASHTYDDTFAHYLYGRLGRHLTLLQALRSRLRSPGPDGDRAG